jgi:hypothetical protein
MVDLYAVKSREENRANGAWIIQDGKTTVFLSFSAIREQYGEIPVLDLESRKYPAWKELA